MGNLGIKQIDYFLDKIDPDKDRWLWDLQEFIDANCFDAWGSKVKHHSWFEWYKHHILEILNLSDALYDTLSIYKELNFTRVQAYEVLFLHDIEKPIKYTKNTSSYILELQWQTTEEIRKHLIERFNININPEIRHALKYIHWEGGDYSPTENIMSELWAHCHSCDTLSARIIGIDYNEELYKKY